MKPAKVEQARYPLRRGASFWSLVVGLLLAGGGPPGLAQQADERPGEWRITPRLSVGMTYSDNINLAPADQAESDLVLQVDPGVSVRKRGGGLDVRLDYTAQGLLYTQQGETKVNNNLLAFGTAELYQKHLFLDAYGSISQVPVTSSGRVDVGNLGFGGGGLGGGLSFFNNLNLDVLPNGSEIFNPIGIFSNIALTNDQTTQANFGISPYWRQDFGGWTNALLRYRYDDTGYGQSQFNSQNNTVQLDLNSGRRFSVLKWSLSYFYQQQNQNDQQGDNPVLGGGNTRQESVSGQANYQLSNAWALVAQAGYQDNTGYQDNQNGPYWGLGAIWSPNHFYSLTGLYGLNFNKAAVQWNPSPRTSFQVSRTYQGVGTSPGVYWNGSLSYKTQFSTWTASYTEQVTTVQQLLGSSLTGLGPNGQPIVLDEQGQIIIPGGTLGLTNQPFLQKYFNAGVTYRRGRNALGFSAFSENRQYQDTNLNNEDTYGAGALWTWRFAQRTASFLGTGWERDDLGNDQQNDYWVSIIGLAQVFSPDSGGLISYRYYQNNANPSDQGFRENRLNVRFSMKF